MQNTEAGGGGVCRLGVRMCQLVVRRNLQTHNYHRIHYQIIQFLRRIGMCTVYYIFSLDASGSDLVEWLECLTANAEVATVLSQHPSTHWNLRGGR